MTFMTWHAGRWALGAGRWALGAGRWALGAGRWALGAGLIVEGSGVIKNQDSTKIYWPVFSMGGLEGRRERVCFQVRSMSRALTISPTACFRR